MKLGVAWVAAVMGFLAGSADAAPVLIVSGGILQGATGVVVGGGTYDVSFVDGTCAALFTGCDEATDFPFQTAEASADAAQALLDSVFLDGAAGNFDTNPLLIRGCVTAPLFCNATNPYTVSPSLMVSTFHAHNDPVESLDAVAAGAAPNTFDLTNVPPVTWAVFTVAAPAVPVPEPASLTLLALGGVGLGCYRRHRRR